MWRVNYMAYTARYSTSSGYTAPRTQDSTSSSDRASLSAIPDG